MIMSETAKKIKVNINRERESRMCVRSSVHMMSGFAFNE